MPETLSNVLNNIVRPFFIGIEEDRSVSVRVAIRIHMGADRRVTQKPFVGVNRRSGDRAPQQVMYNHALWGRYEH